jgi:hypothetical protein
MLDRRSRRKLRNWVLGVLGPPLVRAWAGSLRVRILTDVDVDLDHGRIRIPDCIALVWHQRLFTLASSFPNSGFSTLVSQHADGEMLARVLEGIGLKAVRGSSTRGGVQAIRELMRTGKGPVRIAITPDGPRGPPFVLQQGAIYLASRTGLPIFPVAVGLGSAWHLPTWDGFLLPKPFSRALLRIGEKLEVPPDLDRDGVESWRRRVEASLRELTEDTDRKFAELYRSGTKFRGFLSG